MATLKIVLQILFIIDSLALTVIVLLQEGRTQGLGAVNGIADTYWGQNKGRMLEGKLLIATRVLGVLFFVIAGLLASKLFS